VALNYMQNEVDVLLELRGDDKMGTMIAICRGLWETCNHQSRQINELQQQILHLDRKIREIGEK